MEYGCIGEHLTHSFSREIHEKIGSYRYELKEIPAGELDAFLEARPFRAINVTIPYKEKVIPHLAFLSDEARSIGAVNTVVNRDGKLFGYNTDYTGIAMLAARTGISFRGKKVLILGTGGTSKTACAVVRDAGARRILRVSRSGRDGAVTYEEAVSRHNDAEILINTTPCGMFPDSAPCPIDISRFPSLEGVLDAIYNPLRTNLILQAQKRGIPASGGLFMLVAQAVAASDIFLGTKHREADVNRIYDSVYAEKINTVLIGMPSCGKTTVGTLLANRTGRTFLDTDLLFSETYGKTPAEVIRAEGTDAFRTMETDVIRRVSERNGLILAVGGGSVLRQENVTELKKNGLLFWLDRSCDLLTPTPDRPLSDTPEKLRALYEERRPIYASVADVTLHSDAEAEERAAWIKKRLQL